MSRAYLSQKGIVDHFMMNELESSRQPRFRLDRAGTLAVSLFMLLFPGCSQIEAAAKSPVPSATDTIPAPTMPQASPPPRLEAISPSTNTPSTAFDLDTTLYVSFGREQNEIWVIPGKDSEPRVIYQLPLQLSLREAEQAKLLYPEEASAMREYHATGPPPGLPSADEIPLDIGIWSLSLSPSGGSLAWEETYEWETSGSVTYGQQAIKLMDLNSLEVTTAVHTPEILGPPVWSPDGKKIAFHEVPRSVGGPPPSVWAYEVATDKLSEIGEGYEPTWAPDSTRLAAEHMSSGFPLKFLGLRILLLEGGPPVPVNLGSWDNPETLAWSPTQDQLAFIAPVDRRGMLLVVDLLSGDVRQLVGTHDYIGVVEWPVWSPDGSRLATVAQTASGHGELLVLDVNNGTAIMTPIPADGYYRFFNEPSIEWSPDGLALLVFTAPSHEELQADGRTLYTYNRTSTESFIRGQFAVVGIPDGRYTPITFPPILEESPSWVAGPTSITW